MSLNSMTGFGRAEGSYEGQSWVWEVRSVNGRGLDVRLRLPPGSDALEARVREALARRFSRGSISINLAVQRTGGVTEIRLNEQALAQVLAAADRVRALAGGERPPVDALLSMRGVLEVVEPIDDEAHQKPRHDAMVASLEHALGDLARARTQEGDRLSVVISGQLDEIGRLVAEVRESPLRTREAIAERLAEQVRRLVEANGVLDPQRLHQEAVLLATKADVAEELERLASHIVAARGLMEEAGSVGRKLDFLMQEFNREANTLCSKSNATEITRAGLALKVVIDQMREQVANIE
ncbi:MAG: YicC family protein [Hyphomicrobiaceae bacterium]|nr:YicC family protein [Hyphomicrobiaceae bacterium]